MSFDDYKVCLLSDCPELIKYYLVTKVHLTASRSISIIGNLSISSEFDESNKYKAKNIETCNIVL